MDFLVDPNEPPNYRGEAASRSNTNLIRGLKNPLSLWRLLWLFRDIFDTHNDYIRGALRPDRVENFQKN